MKPITVELSKYHLKGLLEGTTTVESMRFPSWKIACAWAGGVTMNTAVSYVVLGMSGENGEVAMF
jgi:hypothetical protein|tara:strand:+ start:647 stop:841 length:195 start_codon:yes stop_codon:yes gene_type:complete